MNDHYCEYMSNNFISDYEFIVSELVVFRFKLILIQLSVIVVSDILSEASLCFFNRD